MSLLNPVQRDQIMTACPGTSPGKVMAEVASASAVALPRMGGASGIGRGIFSSRGNNPWLKPRAPDPYLVVDSHGHHGRVKRRLGGAHNLPSSILSRALAPAPTVPVRIVGGGRPSVLRPVILAQCSTTGYPIRSHTPEGSYWSTPQAGKSVQRLLPWLLGEATQRSEGECLGRGGVRLLAGQRKG